MQKALFKSMTSQQASFASLVGGTRNFSSKTFKLVSNHTPDSILKYSKLQCHTVLSR